MEAAEDGVAARAEGAVQQALRMAVRDKSEWPARMRWGRQKVTVGVSIQIRVEVDIKHQRGHLAEELEHVVRLRTGLESGKRTWENGTLNPAPRLPLHRPDPQNLERTVLPLGTRTTTPKARRRS